MSKNENLKILGTPDTVNYISIDIMENTGLVRAGFTTRCDWSYRCIAGTMGIEIERTVHSKQTHSCNVQRVTLADGGEGTMRVSSILDTDAIVTDERDFALCAIMSDCAAVYLFDPVKMCAGLAHSGRKGTEGNIVAATVKKMEECFGTVPKDVIAAISPCICRECYEVDDKTCQHFLDCFPKEWHNIIMSVNQGRFYLDITAAIRLQLQEIGICQIQMPVACTRHSGHFFSRRGGDGSTSNVAWLMLKK